MKQYPLLFSILMLITSCAESFDTIDPQPFNKIIANRTDIKTPEELIKSFYYIAPEEGHSEPTITSEKTKENTYHITMIEENMADDSQAGIKIVMDAELNGEIWIVSSLKMNWKCYEGRGHTSWGTEKCN